MYLGILLISALLMVSQFANTAAAQEPIPYGAPITLEHARKIIAAGEEEAKKNKWPVIIAIVDSGAHLVALARMDNTQLGSVDVAIEKARCSALFRRPTKAFEDLVAGGGAGVRALKTPNVLPIEGGVPIVVDGKIIGAIGVSGVKPNEDGIIAQAALNAK
jgi:glc operon protein GlcG